MRPSSAQVLAFGVAISVAVSVAGCGWEQATLPDQGPTRPVSLRFTVEPEYAVAGQPIGPGVSVTVFDNTGDTVYSSTATIRLSIQLGTGTASARLRGGTQVAAVNGTAAFPDVNIDSAGSGYRLLAVANGLGAAASDAFDVVAAAAARLRFPAIATPPRFE